MESKFFGVLPKNYAPLKDWRLLILLATFALAVVDIFVQYSLDLGLFYSVTSGIFAAVLFIELFSRLKMKRTWIGYNLSLYLAIIYILGDVLTYTS